MAPPTNKKSSPEPDEFKAIFFSPQGEASFHEGKLDTLAPGFEVQGSVWEAMMGEPAMRSRLEHWVEEKAKERVTLLLKDRGEAVERESRQKGFELGRNQAIADAAEGEERLNTICDALLDQTHQVLAQHERIWSEALGKILAAFLIDKPKPSLESITTWLKTQREEFLQSGKLVVYLSPQDFGGSLPIHETAKWEWRLDTALKTGEIRAEAEGAGIFFSPDQQWKKLEELLDRGMRGAG